MKLKFLNFSAVRKFVHGKGKRLSTNFLEALDEYCAGALDESIERAKDVRTLTANHVAASTQRED